MEENLVLNNYLRDTAILKETLEQLEKDFFQSGIDQEFQSMAVLSFEKMCCSLSERLKLLNEKNGSQLQNLLYRIDISPKQISQYTKSHPQKDYELLLAELMLKRELQKVVLRKNYS